MAFVLSLFAGRLVLLQGVDPDSYALAATKENTKPFDLHASRGAIVDRNGVPLSVSEDAVAITADPTQTKPVAQQLADDPGAEADQYDVRETARRDDRQGPVRRARPPGQPADLERDRGRAEGEELPDRAIRGYLLD